MYKLDHRLNLPIKKLKLIAKNLCVFGKYILTRMFERNAKEFFFIEYHFKPFLLSPLNILKIYTCIEIL